jgi:hypothetical protein
VSAVTIYGLGNFYDSATETPTVVIDITGGGGGSQNLQSVTTIGATTTVNSTFNGVNIGTYSSTPSVTSSGTTMALANSTNAVGLVSSAWQGAGNNTNDLGSAGTSWNNVYATTYRIGSGTATITASGNNINLNGVASAVPTVGLAPVTTDTYFLGGSTLKWKSLYLGTGVIDWNSYAIPAPAGATTTFLRNDGTWAVPSGSGTGTVTTVGTGTGLTGGPITTTGTISLANTAVTPGSYTAANITVDAQGRITAAANGSGSGTVTSITAGSGLSGGTITTSGTVSLNLANVNTWTGKQTFNGEFQTNSVGSVSGVGISPVADNTYYCGGSALRWAGVYTTALNATGAFTWNSYAISAPAGSTSTFLRNDGTWATPAGGGGTTTNAVTFNSGGSGGGSGSTFNGASALTVSYNTVGAPSTGGTGATGTWGISVSGTSAGLSGSPSITVTGVTVGSATTAVGSSGTNTTLGNNTVFVAPSTGLAPAVDNSYILGSPSFRWTTVYATTGTINTSDARQKQQDRPLSEAERAVAVRVKGLIKTFKFNESVAAKGDGARIHIGVYAQELADAFAAEGLDATHYGMFCRDELEGSEIYGVRYEELLAFVIAVL